jgi:hypothetical protein
MAYRGEASTYEVELTGGKVLRVSAANTDRGGRSYAAGAAVTLGWDAAAAIVLPP